jgi:hypothetical protein
MRDDLQRVHSVPFHALKNVGGLRQVLFTPSVLIKWLRTDFEDTEMAGCVDTTIYAIMLEENYKEMLHQGDEVDLRVQLWRDAIEICKSHSNSMSFISI